MAAKRIAKTSVDWAFMAQKVPKNQINEFNMFKAKNTGYCSKLVGLPESLPAIDWAAYAKVSPAMVADFKKQYEALQVPYPANTYEAAIDKDAAAEAVAVKKFVAEQEEVLVQSKKDIARLDNMIRPSEMTFEEFVIAFPDEYFDAFETEWIWPYTKEDQPQYLREQISLGKMAEEMGEH